MWLILAYFLIVNRFLEPTHWDNNPEVWAEIPKGTLSESIIKEVDKLYEILKDNHLLD